MIRTTETRTGGVIVLIVASRAQEIPATTVTDIEAMAGSTATAFTTIRTLSPLSAPIPTRGGGDKSDDKCC